MKYIWLNVPLNKVLSPLRSTFSLTSENIKVYFSLNEEKNKLSSDLYLTSENLKKNS